MAPSGHDRLLAGDTASTSSAQTVTGNRSAASSRPSRVSAYPPSSCITSPVDRNSLRRVFSKAGLPDERAAAAIREPCDAIPRKTAIDKRCTCSLVI